jgi:hypothetical protein
MPSNRPKMINQCERRRVVISTHMRGAAGLAVAVIAPLVFGLGACGSGSRGAATLSTGLPKGLLTLQNDTVNVVQVAECSGAAPTGCIELAFRRIGPNGSATFHLSSPKIGSTPYSIVIRERGKRDGCLTVPSQRGSAFLVRVSFATQAQCTIQDRNASFSTRTP